MVTKSRSLLDILPEFGDQVSRAASPLGEASRAELKLRVPGDQRSVVDTLRNEKHNRFLPIDQARRELLVLERFRNRVELAKAKNESNRKLDLLRGAVDEGVARILLPVLITETVNEIRRKFSSFVDKYIAESATSITVRAGEQEIKHLSKSWSGLGICIDCEPDERAGRITILKDQAEISIDFLELQRNIEGEFKEALHAGR